VQIAGMARKVNRNNECRVGLHQRPEVRSFSGQWFPRRAQSDFSPARFMTLSLLCLFLVGIDAVVVCGSGLWPLPSCNTWRFPNNYARYALWFPQSPFDRPDPAYLTTSESSKGLPVWRDPTRAPGVPSLANAWATSDDLSCPLARREFAITLAVRRSSDTGSNSRESLPWSRLSPGTKY